MKQAILAIVAGMMIVAPTSIHAQKSAGELVDDGAIAASIKAGLLDNRHTSAATINVESYQGVVQLSGFVGSTGERDTAGKVASEVTGVRKVVNSLVVAPKTSIGTKLDDSITTGKVKAALMDSADVKSLQINVETKDGVTQLAGFVPSQAMKDKAGRVAAGVSGVKRLDNALVVK